MTVLASCENNGYDDYEVAKTPSAEMNGEWVVEISDADTGDVYADHVSTATYDTNASDNKMFINDFKSSGLNAIYSIKSAVDVNVTNLTFSVTAASNLNVAGSTTVTVSEGKIFKKAAHTPAGNLTDSIYYKVQYSSDPNTTLIYAGYKRTGFIEDEN